MIITNKCIPVNHPVKFGPNILEPVASARFLGLTVDDRLNFSIHAQDVVSRMARGIGVMRRLLNLLPPSTLRSLFYSLIYCHNVGDMIYRFGDMLINL